MPKFNEEFTDSLTTQQKIDPCFLSFEENALQDMLCKWLHLLTCTQTHNALCTSCAITVHSATRMTDLLKQL